MTTVPVHASTCYDVLIEPGCLPSLGAQVARVTQARRVALVSDDAVYSLHGAAAENALTKQGFHVTHCCFPHGEASKNVSTLSLLLESFAENGLDRGDAIVALGGGVVGDLTGLAAALYLRGVAYVSVPTTLLAQVDSSVGGKTAIDLAHGKNLAGAFWQPRLVLCDPELLRTLPAQEFSNGMAEVIKYAVGFSSRLFSLIQEDAKAHLEEVIAACVTIKRDLVERDELDTGERKKLNLGHTIGHAIEACSHYSVNHGQAVAAGLSMLCRALCPELAPTVDALCMQYGLSTRCDYSADALYAALTLDKKKHGEYLSLIVPKKIGACEIRETPLSELRALLAEVCR